MMCKEDLDWPLAFLMVVGGVLLVSTCTSYVNPDSSYDQAFLKVLADGSAVITGASLLPSLLRMGFLHSLVKDRLSVKGVVPPAVTGFAAFACRISIAEISSVVNITTEVLALSCFSILLSQVVCNNAYKAVFARYSGEPVRLGEDPARPTVDYGALPTPSVEY